MESCRCGGWPRAAPVRRKRSRAPTAARLRRPRAGLGCRWRDKGGERRGRVGRECVFFFYILTIGESKFWVLEYCNVGDPNAQMGLIFRLCLLEIVLDESI
jgi:hypothetical protein